MVEYLSLRSTKFSILNARGHNMVQEALYNP